MQVKLRKFWMYVFFLLLFSGAVFSASIPSDYCAYWRFDNANGSNSTFTPDETGKNNGTVTSAVNGSAGYVNQAYTYSGTSQYITAPKSTIADNITMVAWIKVARNSNALQYIVGNQNSSVSGWYMRKETSNKPSCQFTTGGGGAANISGTTATAVPTVGVWYHVTCVFNGTNNMIYINGALDNSTAWTGPKTQRQNNLGITLGKYALNSNYYWNGTIDEVILYNRSLTGTEVSDLYDAYFGFSVNLSSPANNTPVQNARNITLNFSVKGAFTSYNCSLYVNDALNQTNDSVENNTVTGFDLNLSLAGTYLWNVSCSRRSITNSSETRNFTVEKTAYLSSDNSEGYTFLEACLDAINNTNDGCVLNVSNYSETFSGGKSYYFDCQSFGSDAMNFNSQQNVTIDFNNANIEYRCGQGTTLIWLTSGNNTIMNLSVNVPQVASFVIKTDNGGEEGIDFKNINIVGNCNSGIRYGGTSGGLYTITNSQVDCNIDTYGAIDAENLTLSSGGFVLYTNSKIKNVDLGNSQLFLTGYGISASNLIIDNITTTKSLLTSTVYHDNVTIINSQFSSITDSHPINLSNTTLGQNTNWQIENNSFDNIGSVSYTSSYVIGNTRYSYGGNDFSSSQPIMIDETLSSTIPINTEGKDVSNLVNGTANFNLWLIDLPALGLPMTVAYVRTGEIYTCDFVASAYGGTCYLEETNFLIANGENTNYTFKNVSGLTIYDGTNPNFLTFNNVTNYDLVPIYSVDAENVTIKNNTFTNSLTPIIINATNVYITENTFEDYPPVNFTPANYCVEEEGNFYEETITNIPSGDCGPANITVPGENDAKDNTFLVSWRKQSSFLDVIYDIFIKKIGGAFTLLGSTNSTNYSIDTTAYDNSNYALKIVPWVNGSGINATNALRNFSINNALHIPALLTPSAGEIVIDRTPFFSWNSSSEEEVTVYYNLLADNDSDFSSPEINITTTDTNYTPLSGLYFTDYFWKVNANDTVYVTGYSAARNFTLIKSISCSLPVNSFDFGAINKSEKKNTTGGTAIIIENSGNIRLNVSVNATNLWAYHPNPTQYYQYIISENETGSFENALNDSWHNISNQPLPSITGLNYGVSNDSARMDIQIEAPDGEGAGAKTSTITVWCEEDE